MGFLNKFLLGYLPHTVQVGAVTAGHQRHRSPTGLTGRGRNKTFNRRLAFFALFKKKVYQHHI